MSKRIHPKKLNGTLRKHGKTLGYVVERSGGGIGSDCHGYDDANDHQLLLAKPVTLFSTRAQATRAIRDSLKNDSREKYYIHRVARRT